MRLLSQNKNIDVAYDYNTVIKLTSYHNGKCSIDAFIGNLSYLEMAIYSKEEYARKAFENMKEAYNGRLGINSYNNLLYQNSYFIFPSEEQIIEQINKEKELKAEILNKIPYKG
jgi:hypothetical protein